MENKITRTIKFTDKKCIMKPIDGNSGLTELWSTIPNDNVSKNVYFKYEGKTYYLTASSINE
jgi:hypothetical protein